MLNKFYILALCEFCNIISIQATHKESKEVAVIPSKAKFINDWENRVGRGNEPVVNEIKHHTLPPPARDGLLDIILEPGRQKVMCIIKFFKKLLNINQGSLASEGTFGPSKLTCTACIVGVGILKTCIAKGTPHEESKRRINEFCIELNLQTDRVCAGLTELFINEVLHVLRKLTTMDPDEICAFILGQTCGEIESPIHYWKVTFPPNLKPIPAKPRIPESNATSFKVLHLSDTHFDPYYMIGANAECNEPLCCRLTNGPAQSKKSKAGKWGDYRKCDTPRILINSMFQHIKDTHDLDYIIWTGDLPPHDIWNQTRAGNLEVLRQTVKQILDFFPGVPVFPCVGNHEAAPSNSFPPPFITEPKFSTAWLYDELDIQWQNWLPKDVSGSVRRGAFYSVLVRPGLRLISLNMNYCYNLNWWLAIDSTDPVAQLEWLIIELQSAESIGEKVHIIGHIPPGHSDCIKVWSHNYYKIISRYESTVTAQFFGHTHKDEFEVFYDHQNLSRPVNIAYIGPSVTPYHHLNPGYRIYYVDGDHNKTTWAVVDHETWTMNLEMENILNSKEPKWFKLYSARKAFKMEALRSKDWDNLIERMISNVVLFDKFYSFHFKSSSVTRNCDGDCRKKMLCKLRSGRSHDHEHLCKSIESEIDYMSTWIGWIHRELLYPFKFLKDLFRLPKKIFG